MKTYQIRYSTDNNVNALYGTYRKFSEMENERLAFIKSITKSDLDRREKSNLIKSINVS